MGSVLVVCFDFESSICLLDGREALKEKGVSGIGREERGTRDTGDGALDQGSD